MKNPLKIQSLLVFFGISWAALLVACGNDPPSSGFDPYISPRHASVQPGSQQQFIVTVVDLEGSIRENVPLQWSSSSTTVATVDKNGLATAVTEGSAHISACIEGRGNDQKCSHAILNSFQPRSRPSEIAYIFPGEDEHFSRDGLLFPYPPCGVHCSAGPLPPLPKVHAAFSFQAPDRFKSARMILDGAEVITDSYWCCGILMEGSIFYPPGQNSNISFSSLATALSLGLHTVTVEATSTTAQTITYTWSFTLEE